MILPTEAAAVSWPLAPAFTATDRPPLRPAGRRRHPDHRPAHRRQPAPHRSAASPPGHRTTYQRVLSSAPWSGLRLACASAALRPAPAARRRPGRPGRRRHGRRPPGQAASTARPATATRSAPATATPPGATATSGSSWPCWSASPSPPGPGPCPCWSTCTAAEEDDRRRGRPHRTPAQLMCRLLRLVLLRVPRPPLRLRRRRRLRHARGGPLLPPPPRPADAGQQAAPRGQPVRAAAALRRQGPAAGQGRPACPSRAQAVAAAPRLRRRTVALVRRRHAAGGRRSAAPGTGTRRATGWCRSAGCSSATATGTHRDEYFFSTDPALEPGGDHRPLRRRAGTSRPPSRRLRAHLGLETAGPDFHSLLPAGEGAPKGRMRGSGFEMDLSA